MQKKEKANGEPFAPGVNLHFPLEKVVASADPSGFLLKVGFRHRAGDFGLLVMCVGNAHNSRLFHDRKAKEGCQGINIYLKRERKSAPLMVSSVAKE